MRRSGHTERTPVGVGGCTGVVMTLSIHISPYSPAGERNPPFISETQILLKPCGGNGEARILLISACLLPSPDVTCPSAGQASVQGVNYLFPVQKCPPHTASTGLEDAVASGFEGRGTQHNRTNTASSRREKQRKKPEQGPGFRSGRSSTAPDLGLIVMCVQHAGGLTRAW